MITNQNNQNVFSKRHSHALQEKVLVLSMDFNIHQQIKSQMSHSDMGMIHITDTDMALSMLQEQRVEHVIWDAENHDFAGLHRIAKKNSKTFAMYLLSNDSTLASTSREHNHSMVVVKPSDLQKIPDMIQANESHEASSHENVSEGSKETQGEQLLSKIKSELIGESQAIKKVQNTILQLKETDINVLIRGESGTGKGIVSRLIHYLSPRSLSGDFVTINCPSIPESLFESEIFGHEAGAYTGATKQKPGRLEIGNQGTVFFDEIGEIPTSIQAKLLEFLEAKQFTRVGGTKLHTLDTRIISATNAPLESLMKNQMFRQDLFYRLNEYVIHLPPLRERIGDIPILVDHFLHELSSENESIRPLSNETLQMMLEYSWPGNVRELRSIIKTYAFTQDESLIQNAVGGHNGSHDSVKTSERMEKMEAQTILATLNETRWNQKKAANLLGISYSTIRRKIKKFQLAG